ncbi:MAG TPA: formylglycine-generating enzyme family protein [Rhizomicrobium sp.]|nr:formylglycine-generating enzyme family protein [Rhizomicrobium sp.]
MAAKALIAVAGLAALTTAGWLVFAETPSFAAKPPPICLKDAPANGPHSGMVWIPAGTFQFGGTVYGEEGPVVSAHVAGFWMDRHEVTNAQFAAFVKATGYVTQAEKPVDTKLHPDLPPDMQKAGAMTFVMPKSVDGMQNIAQWWRYTPGANWRHPAGPGSSIAGHENYPVVEITYADALAYAKWKGRALPTEREWEWAARAGNPKAGLDHDQPKNANTWQGIFPVVNSDEDGFVGLAPAGCYPPNAYGLYDMIGNAWEWTSDVFAPGHAAQEPSQAGEARAALASNSYVIKGGSFLCAPNYCMRYRSGAREPQEADLAASHLGFRTISRAPGPKSATAEKP